jgi:hypothetical protein
MISATSFGGMIASVDRAGRGVAHAVPAEDLWAALASAGAGTEVRISDAMDKRAEEAMAGIRAHYEAQLANVGLEKEQMRQELDRLRQGVNVLGQEARESQNPHAAEEALDALAVGNVVPATEVLRRQMEERFAAATAANKEAAAAARSLARC